MKIKLLSLFFLSSFLMLAQNSTNSSGGSAIGTTGSSTYSVGQVVYTSINNANVSMNQGIQIPYEIITLGVNDFPQIQLQMIVFPNPITSNAILKIEQFDFQNLQYQITDFQGKQLITAIVQNAETAIQLENYATGIYFMTIYSNNKNIKTFKIIKK